MAAEAFPHTEELVLGLYDTGEIIYMPHPTDGSQPENADYPREVFKKLKSGRMSPHFVNTRRVTSWSPSLGVPLEVQKRTRRLVVDGMGYILDGLEYDHLLGLPMAVTCLSGALGEAREESVLWMREPTEANQKKYGIHELIEGHYAEGEKVVVNDNVVTDAGTKKESVEPITGVGLEIVSFNVLVDREEGGKEIIEAAGYSFAAVVGMQTINEILRAERRITADQHRWGVEYRERVLSGVEDAAVAEDKVRAAEQ